MWSVNYRLNCCDDTEICNCELAKEYIKYKNNYIRYCVDHHKIFVFRNICETCRSHLTETHDCEDQMFRLIDGILSFNNLKSPV